MIYQFFEALGLVETRSRTAKNGALGVSGRCKNSASDISSHETQENPTATG